MRPVWEPAGSWRQGCSGAQRTARISHAELAAQRGRALTDSGKLLAADPYGIRVNWSSRVDMEIVIGGADKRLGMPRFAYMRAADLELIKAYMVNRAWDAYESQ